MIKDLMAKADHAATSHLNQTDKVIEEIEDSVSSVDKAAQNKKETIQKYAERYTLNEEVIPCPATRIESMAVKLSTIPIDLLYNAEINKIKGIEFCGVARSIPITFDLEHDSFAHNDT